MDNVLSRPLFDLGAEILIRKFIRKVSLTCRRFWAAENAIKFLSFATHRLQVQFTARCRRLIFSCWQKGVEKKKAEQENRNNDTGQYFVWQPTREFVSSPNDDGCKCEGVKDDNWVKIF